jgi:chromosome segregation ATPase
MIHRDGTPMSGYQPKEPLDVKNPPRGGSGVRGVPPAEPLSLQRQIDKLSDEVDHSIVEMEITNARLDALEKRESLAVDEVDSVNNRLEEIERKIGDIVEIHGKCLKKQADTISKMAERMDGLDTLEKYIRSVETQLNCLEADVPGNFAADFDHLKMLVQSLFNRTSDLEEIRERSKHTAKKSDYLMVETDLQNRRMDGMEKKIDACRVATHNVDKIVAEHTIRLHGLDNILKDKPDPWEVRWNSLKAYVTERRKTAGSVRLEMCQHVLEEMEALEKGI